MSCQKSTQHTNCPASTVCHLALFCAVLVWSHVCICVNSQTNAGGSKKDTPGRKIPLQITEAARLLHWHILYARLPLKHQHPKHVCTFKRQRALLPALL